MRFGEPLLLLLLLQRAARGMEVVGALSRAAGDPAIPASRGGHVRPQTRHLLQRPRHRPEFPVFDLCGTKIGIQICYDRKYPEGSRLLALKGAEILFMPICAATYGETKLRDRTWEVPLQARAYENGVYVVAVNRAGDEKGRKHIGRSMIVDPV